MTSQASATCQSQFSWMTNNMSQSPCEVGEWLIGICEGSSVSASVGPLSTDQPSYKVPNGTSATTCTCSWAFYNSLMACTACQGFNQSIADWTSWSSECGLLGKVSTSSYWPLDQSLGGHTSLPRWSIVNATSWADQTFNVDQAQAIANENLPDVTDSLASQPSVPPASSTSTSTSSSSPTSQSDSKSTPIGAVVGGVVGGVAFLGLVAFLLWYLCFYRRKVHHSHWRRPHLDLNAEEKVLESPPVTAGFSGTGFPNGPGMSGMSVESFNPYAAQQQQGTQQGYAQATYPGAPGPIPAPATAPSSLPPSARPTTIQTYPITGAGAGRIPTVAEQLSEKRRIREERRRGGRTAIASASVSSNNTSRPQVQGAPPSAYHGAGTGVDENGVLTYTGMHSRDLSASGSSSNFNTNTQTATHSPSNSQSGFFAHLPGTGARKPGAETAEGGQQQRQRRRSSRRLSFTKAPWNRRRPAVSEPASSVVGDADDVGDTPRSPHTDTDRQSQEGALSPASPRRPAPEDVIASIPGARLPSARDREQPPPSYVPVPPVNDVTLALASAQAQGARVGRRLTVMNESGETD